MTIAIDLDNTWTQDPTLWSEFRISAIKRGHTVIMATGRSGYSSDMDRWRIPGDMPIFYCAGELKDNALKREGIYVDVWIDDMPGMIQKCKILGGEL